MILVSVKKTDCSPIQLQSPATHAAKWDRNLLYRCQTQDKGSLTNGTGMIVLPQGKTEAVLVWLHPTMGFNDSCSPTATGVIGAAYPAIFSH